MRSNISTSHSTKAEPSSALRTRPRTFQSGTVNQVQLREQGSKCPPHATCRQVALQLEPQSVASAGHRVRFDDAPYVASSHFELLLLQHLVEAIGGAGRGPAAQHLETTIVVEGEALHGLDVFPEVVVAEGFDLLRDAAHLGLSEFRLCATAVVREALYMDEPRLPAVGNGAAGGAAGARRAAPRRLRTWGARSSVFHPPLHLGEAAAHLLERALVHLEPLVDPLDVLARRDALLLQDSGQDPRQNLFIHNVC